MNLEIQYRSHYFDDAELKSSFEQYAMSVFGLDFRRWKEKGLWSHRYTPFSAFVGKQCIASICVYSCLLTIDHKKMNGAQLLTVGTLPEYRGQGIQREIWDRASTWCIKNHDFTFLFTDEKAAGLYEKLGLIRKEEHVEVVEIQPLEMTSNGSYRKLFIKDEDDYQIAYRLAHERTVVSNRIGFHNPKLLLFMLLYPYKDRMYYIEELDCIVIVERRKDKLRVHDIIAVEMPSYEKIEPLLGQFGKKKIEFLFCADRLDLKNADKQLLKESVLFVSKNFKFSQKMMFPASIRA
ncbi:MAG: GNAT family N-acetyltransferase [Candidatus Eisenbacteria bacterium]|nr:GNAT family N-acetyltransferase [Candidatus Eisenbacteria bacterium]MBU1948804.1 GNAT family N-acetyltransferase [Candidatus Eisenbacteria bacterium]